MIKKTLAIVAAFLSTLVYAEQQSAPPAHESKTSELKQAASGGSGPVTAVSPAMPQTVSGSSTATATAVTSTGDVLVATDLPTIQSRVGQQARIHGHVQRVAVGGKAQITFINFAGVERGGFVGIVMQPSLPDVSAAFGGNLSTALTGNDVELSGVVNSHNGTPQISITRPDQIRILSK